ncbi:bifunctional (p)ppGpp synthetase/guanosine-3',5'-bis(diphosphate) 3'-pyrophosphohydrolase [bacterium]|nr:bifunctional (p)ppGpp synthetase/guanosine-3',5'-bis(diphosphate) 3'-pyrophosphohydrolase [bacterium]
MIRFNDILEKVSSSFKEKDTTLLKKAYVFAARAHKGQNRRSGEPYLSHPLEVTNMLADMNLDVTSLVAALLHDVPEDTEASSEEIKQTFGTNVAHLVDGVTKISRMEENLPEKRKAQTIQKIILTMTDDLRVIFIKLADRIHNLKTLKFLEEKKQQRIARETLEIYAPIANRLGIGRIKAELEDLSFRYVDPDNYFKIASLVEPQRKKSQRELNRIKRNLQKILQENRIPAEIFYRIKRLYSIYHKMNHQNIDFSQVYDFIALRLITNSVENCYSALGIIHQQWPHLPHRFRDFIAMPKSNLYQALHTTIITDKKQTIEIQIRTQEMHTLAKHGIAAHWKYKETDSRAMVKEDQRLHWLREMVDLYQEQKNPNVFLKNLKSKLIPEDVYVFTPKGKVITLPMGASALDFAFKIHTEIGLHAEAAKVNGQKVPLKTPLKTGNIVEILTSPQKNPSRDWLNLVFTSTARHHIKRWLNQQDRIKNTSLGKKLWKKEVEKYKVPPYMQKEDFILQRLSKISSFRAQKMDDFYALIGFGKIILNKKFMEKLFSTQELSPKKDHLFRKVVTKVSKKQKSSIKVRDESGKAVHLAKCCSPIKGEPIIGYITSGKGITVHSQRCPLVTKEILNHQRMVEVSWEDSLKGTYKGSLLIRAEDAPGVLAKITAAIAQLQGNITKAEVNTFGNKKARTKLTLKIKDIGHLENIIKKLSRIQEISSVERI